MTRDAEMLPTEVKALVRRHVPTPLHLELLVALAREPGASLSAAALRSTKHTDVAAIERTLQDFLNSGLLQATGSGASLEYRIATTEPEQLRALAMLVVAWERVPVQLMRTVYDRPPEAIRSFADAFRLQGDK